MSRRLRALVAIALLCFGGLTAACGDDGEKGAPGGEPVNSPAPGHGDGGASSTSIPPDGGEDENVPGGSVPGTSSSTP